MESYCIGKRVGISFDDAIQRVKDVFKEEGFGALTETDIQAALKEKIGEEITPYTILGMCNPNLAHRAIGLEPTIGVLLPCNVLVRKVEGGVEVMAQNPSLFVAGTGNKALEPIAIEARRRIEAALSKL